MRCLTTWPGRPPSIMRGTNVDVQMPMPKTFTPKHQRQSLGSCCHGFAAAAGGDAGVVEQQLDVPERVVHGIGERGDLLLVGDVDRLARHRTKR